MPYKCSHSKCMCVVDDKNKFCSDWCRESVKEIMQPCGCSHPICQEIYGTAK